MRRLLLLIGTLGTLTCWTATAQTVPPPATTVLEHSIAYHDPQDQWQRSRLRLQLEETRADGNSRQTRLQLDNSLHSFEILTNRDDAELEGLMADQDCLWTLNGSIQFTDEERETFQLTCERLTRMRDYYTYLWGLPMKLRDPGTRLDKEAIAESYQDQPVWAIRVTYDEAVGSDTWYFYFDRQTYALVGYRFYHDETKGDGEYIVLEGEIESQGLKIPRRRSWYTHAEDRHLGDDTLVALEIDP